MSNSSILLSAKQLSIITFFAAALALALSSSSSSPFISFIIWIILLFSFFSIAALVITLMARGAKSKTSRSRTTRRRNSCSDETDRLNAIVTKILTPPSKPNLSLFNIHSALEQVYALAEADIDKNIELVRDYDPSIPEINGDENLFIQAILNIVKNSQQAIENTEKPCITIKSRIEYGKPINGTKKKSRQGVNQTT